MPPEMMTRATPSETIPVTERLLRMLAQLVRVKNLSLSRAMARQRRTSSPRMEWFIPSQTALRATCLMPPGPPLRH